MSSNDRYSRSNRQRQAPDPRVPADDDIVYEDQWDVAPGVDDVPPAPRRTRSNPNSGRPQSPRQRSAASTPSVDGTAAQIDRLRRNIRQGARPAGQQAPVQGVRRASQPVVHRAPVHDDQLIPDRIAFDDEVYEPAPPPRRNRPRSAAIPSQRQRASRPVHDPGYDDDPYGDDPYAAYYDEFEDDFSEYDAPRRPARQARPRPQITMPTISRPSLPPAIASADLINDAPALGIIGVGLASLAAMAIIVANQVESLAPGFAAHVSASGILEDFRDEAALWNLPLMAAMFTLMNVVMAWFISPLDRFASRFLLVGALVVQFMVWVAIIRIL